MNIPTPTPGGVLHVLIVDDQTAVRRGLKRLLHCMPGLPPLVVHEAASVEEAHEQAHACTPDVVLLDVDLAGDDGLVLLPMLAPTSRVVVVSSHAGDAGTRRRALALGAAVVVGKAEPGRVLAEAVRGVLQAKLAVSWMPMPANAQPST
jgi:two-component system response regulator DesR